MLSGCAVFFSEGEKTIGVIPSSALKQQYRIPDGAASKFHGPPILLRRAAF